jgi:hypothetical protein
MRFRQLSYVAASPEFIHATIADQYRLQCGYDPEAEPDLEISFETTVAEWRNACDLVGWEEVGRGLNEEYGINVHRDRWFSVLEPASQRRLRGVCELIASEAMVVVVRPASVLGGKCLKAGVFLTIRTLLAQAGADVGDVRPSTPVHRFLPRYLGVFVGPVSRLAPGSLPIVKIGNGTWDGLDVLVGCVPLMPVIAYSLAIIFFAPVGVNLFLAAGWFLAVALGFRLYHYVRASLETRRSAGRRVEIGDVRSFADLSRVIAEHTSCR